MNDSTIREKPSLAVQRAVRRSRSVRAAMQRRRRRAFALAASASLAVGVPLVWSIGPWTGGDLVEAAVSSAKSLAELLDQRSPGDRTQSALTKTKRVHAAAKLHALPGLPAVTAQPNAVPAELAAILSSPPAPALVPVGLVADQSFMTPPPSLGAIFASAPGGSGPGDSPIASPGDTPGPVSFPASEPRETVPVPSAVPEPGTWAMMLVGFGLIGWRVRRRRAARPRRLAV